MKAPISWLNEYTKIKLTVKSLMWKMTEVGITTESYDIVEGEKVLDVEVTPNRPDWLSIMGISREISVIQNSRLKLPKPVNIPKPSAKLPIKVNTGPKLSDRYSGITVAGITIKPSPKFIRHKLKLVGLRPINNLVDITNYVMFETGIPVHVFDYDKFINTELQITKARGGESFTSVDEISYTLPPGAIIIKDTKRVIDLCGIKGGQNTGITKQTKNIFIHVPIYSPHLIRKTSQLMRLSSDASYIYERGPDAGSTMEVLKRVLELTLKYAGGKVASHPIDIKAKNLKPRKILISFSKINKVIGINIPEKKTVSILKKLCFLPKTAGDKIICTIPSYRGDINIQEDLIEEVARVYGYNQLPKTLPVAQLPKDDIPYKFAFSFHNSLKNIAVGSGYLEIATYSLVSKDLINKSQLQVDSHIRIANPVSKEYKFLRTTLVPSLLLSLNQNADEKTLKLFELSKTYHGPLLLSKESYKLTGVEKNTSYLSVKGVVDLIIGRLEISGYRLYPTAVQNGVWHPVKSAVMEKQNNTIAHFGEVHPSVLDNLGINHRVYAFELNVDFLNKYKGVTTYKPPYKYPAQEEDITLIFTKQSLVYDIIMAIRKSHKFIQGVELSGIYENSYTFHIKYQNPKKTLTNAEVVKIRKKLLAVLKKRFGAKYKD